MNNRANARGERTALAQYAPEFTALVVVDMQNAFAASGGLVERTGGNLTTSRAAIPVVASLIQAARRARVRVVYMRVADAPTGASVAPAERARRERIGLPIEAVPDGSWDSEIISEVAPEPHETVITKRRLCGFIGTDLDLVLRSSGVTHLVVAGLQSHACVLSTAWIGSMLGYFVAVPVEATASPRPDLHEAALVLLRHSVHAVPSTDDLIAQWNRAVFHQAGGDRSPR